MNTQQIDMICRKDPNIAPHWLGVFSLNTLPPPAFPSCFIANTANAEESGEHWVAIYFTTENRAFYFCSFGQQPKPEFCKYLKPFKWFRSNRQIQSYNSTCCGHYCIACLHFMNKGMALEDFMSLFTSHDNDDLVVFFVNSLYMFDSEKIDRKFLNKLH